MGNLCVEYAFTIHAMLVNESRAILTEIMEYFYYSLRRQYLLQVVFQSMVKRVNLQHIEQVTMILEA